MAFGASSTLIEASRWTSPKVAKEVHKEIKRIGPALATVPCAAMFDSKFARSP